MFLRPLTRSSAAQCRYLHNNTITGTLPEGWFTDMDRLERLHLSGNELFGSIPDEIGLAEQLEEL